MNDLLEINEKCAVGDMDMPTPTGPSKGVNFKGLLLALVHDHIVIILIFSFVSGVLTLFLAASFIIFLSGIEVEKLKLCLFSGDEQGVTSLTRSTIDPSSADESIADEGPDVAGSGGPRTLVVDLSGAVKFPGVYTLPAGSRIADVLKLGGGFHDEASGRWMSMYVNLSGKLNDSQKVYIPFEWEISPELENATAQTYSYYYDNNVQVRSPEDPGSSGTASSSPSTASSTSSSTTGSADVTKINVNSADETLLDTLPGIGPAYAKRIIENRPYKDILELSELTKIPQSTVDKLKDLISFQ